MKLLVGSREFPLSLESALANVVAGGEVILLPGVYHLDLVSIPDDITVRVDGGRAVVTSSEETPPRITVGSNSTVSGIFFGGTRSDTDHAVTIGDNSTFDGCTFWGYNQCIVMGGHTGIKIKDCLFARNGKTLMPDAGDQHSIYISNGASGHTALVKGSVFIGGQGGYDISMWHEPINATVEQCFFGLSNWAIVTNGAGHRVKDCVLWSARCATESYWAIYLAAGSDIVWSHILFGSDASDYSTGWRQNDTIPEGTTVDGCTFIDNTPVFGTNTATWVEADCTANLGYSKAAVDAAVAAIEASFEEAPATIQADATIAGNLAICRAVVAAWVALGA